MFRTGITILAISLAAFNVFGAPPKPQAEAECSVYVMEPGPNGQPVATPIIQIKNFRIPIAASEPERLRVTIAHAQGWKVKISAAYAVFTADFFLEIETNGKQALLLARDLPETRGLITGIHTISDKSSIYFACATSTK